MYSLITELLQPFPCLVWLTVICTVWVWWRLRDQRRILIWPTLLAVALLLDSLPLTAWLVSVPFETRFPRWYQRPPETRVIVVLGAGIDPPAVRGAPTLPNQASALRAMRAAELYHDGAPCPILVSGGTPDPVDGASSPGAAMVALLKSAGVPDVDLILEEESTNTAQNARFSEQILRQRGLTEGVVIVTSAAHLWRSSLLFQAVGIEVTPVGCDYVVDRTRWNWTLFWPKGSAVMAVQSHVHELLGFLSCWCKGDFEFRPQPVADRH